MLLSYLWPETCGFNVELKNIQNIMAHSCTLYIYIYDIRTHIMCSIYLLTCSNVGPLEDACAWPGGPVRKRQRVDSEAETHLKKLRAWANEWPTQERVVGTLEVFYDSLPWRTRMEPMGAGSLGCWAEFCSVNTHTEGLNGQKKSSQALLWNTLIWVVTHETRGLLCRCDVA